jgi:hypothetical protein
MMNLLTRLKIYGAVISALTLAVPVVLWYGTTGNNEADNYVLSMKWSPATLPPGKIVLITVTVDGFPLIDQRPKRQSPFNETMTAAKGAVIVLTGVSNYGNTQMIDCIIMRNGRSVPSGGFDSMEGPGPVKCVAA